MENREAVAAQLSEVAQIMVTVADDMREGEQQNEDLEEMIRKKLRSMRVSVSSVSMLENREKTAGGVPDHERTAGKMYLDQRDRKCAIQSDK